MKKADPWLDYGYEHMGYNSNPAIREISQKIDEERKEWERLKQKAIMRKHYRKNRERYRLKRLREKPKRIEKYYAERNGTVHLLYPDRKPRTTTVWLYALLKFVSEKTKIKDFAEEIEKAAELIKPYSPNSPQNRKQAFRIIRKAYLNDRYYLISEKNNYDELHYFSEFEDPEEMESIAKQIIEGEGIFPVEKIIKWRECQYSWRAQRRRMIRMTDAEVKALGARKRTSDRKSWQKWYLKNKDTQEYKLRRAQYDRSYYWKNRELILKKQKERRERLKHC